MHQYSAFHSQRHHFENIESEQQTLLNWELFKGKQEGPTLMSDAVI